jgi:hypothetical protein
MLQKVLESRQEPTLSLLCVRTTPISHGLPSPVELFFNRRVQSNLPVVEINEDEIKDSIRKRQVEIKERYDRTV